MNKIQNIFHEIALGARAASLKKIEGGCNLGITNKGLHMFYSMIKKWPLFLALACAMLQGACQPSQPKQMSNTAEKQERGGKEEAEIASVETLKKQVFRLNIGNDPRTLDPARARDLQSITLTRMLFEGLTRINQAETVEMALADKVEISADRKIYTFTLREAKWSNGETVTANDFHYAWSRVLDPKVPADNAFQLYPIKNAQAIKSGQMSLDQLGVKVIDAKTIQVELANPTPYFLELTSYPAFFPINARVDRETPHWIEREDTFVGNGAFVLKEWKRQNCLRVAKSPTYWDASTVKLEEIEMFMMREDTELSMFENKEIDWAGSPLSVLPVDALGKLDAEKILNKKPILGTYFLRINTENKLLSSAKIRRALSFCIDRDDLVGYALGGSQMAATGFVPESLGIRQESYFKGNDAHAAMKQFDEGLEDISLTRTQLPELELLFSTSERNQRIAQMLQERWLKILGVKVVLAGVEFKTYIERLHKGDFQIAAGSWMADYSDPLSFLEIFKSRKEGANHTKWENGEYRRLLEASNSVVDPKERMQILAQCEKILLDAMPIVPLFHYNMLFVKDKKVSDVFISNMGTVDFRWAHLERDEERAIR